MTASLDARATDVGDTVSSATHTAGRAIRDTTITAKTKAALAQTSGLSSGDVHVTTRHGVVTLTGSVPDASQRPLAVEAARQIDGVSSVRDKLSIVAK